MRRALLLVFLLAACVTPVPPMPTTVPTVAPPSTVPSVAPAPSGSAVVCAPTDQVAYIYNPSRLVVLGQCIHMTGTVAAVRREADGDFHVLIAPDPAYASLVNAANAGLELGDLVVEPVCEIPVTQTDAVAACAGDKDPLDVTGLAVGQHIWAEGRYVTDSDHGGWAEIHPLAAWGIEPGAGVALPAQTPPPINDEAP